MLCIYRTSGTYSIAHCEQLFFHITLSSYFSYFHFLCKHSYNLMIYQYLHLSTLFRKISIDFAKKYEIKFKMHFKINSYHLIKFILRIIIYIYYYVKYIYANLLYPPPRTTQNSNLRRRRTTIIHYS